MTTIEQAEAYLDSVRRELKACNAPWQARSRLEDIRFATKYAEPGYSHDGPIAFGNWNKFYDDKLSPNVRDLMPTVAERLEEMGVELEWSDEWDFCSECGAAFRTQPNSYNWQRAYYEFECERVCRDCVNPADVLADLEGSSRKALTADLRINPAEHGYVKVATDFENGFHEGQADDPKKIAAACEKWGVSRFLFSLDSVGQFDMDFSLWVHKDEASRWHKLDHNEGRADISPAQALKQALQNMPVLPSKDGRIIVTQCHADGTATAKHVSHEDFVVGKALD